MSMTFEKISDTRWNVSVVGKVIAEIERFTPGKGGFALLKEVIFTFKPDADPSLLLEEMKEIVAYMETLK